MHTIGSLSGGDYLLVHVLRKASIERASLNRCILRCNRTMLTASGNDILSKMNCKRTAYSLGSGYLESPDSKQSEGARRTYVESHYKNSECIDRPD
jgi:hypothetical protein